MRTQFATLLIASALIFSASAQTDGVLDFLDGFVAGLNNTDLINNVNHCQASAPGVSADVANLVQAFQSKDKAAFEDALRTLIDDFAASSQACAGAVSSMRNIVAIYAAQFKSMGSVSIMGNIIGNLGKLTSDASTLESDATSHNFQDAGARIADLLNIVAYGVSTVQSAGIRTVRQLSNLQDPIMEALDAILFSEGFIGTANTTINSTDFGNVMNDIAGLAALIPNVIEAAKNKNYSSLFTQILALASQGSVIARDLPALDAEVKQWLARDLTYFKSLQRIEVAAEYLFFHFDTTSQHIVQMQNSYAQGDFMGMGVAFGIIYNEFYGALSQ